MTSSNITCLNLGKRNLHWCTLDITVSRQLINIHHSSASYLEYSNIEHSIFDSIFDLRSGNSTSIHQFYDLASTRLRLQSFGISLDDDSLVGSLLRRYLVTIDNNLRHREIIASESFLMPHFVGTFPEKKFAAFCSRLFQNKQVIGYLQCYQNR